MKYIHSAHPPVARHDVPWRCIPPGDPRAVPPRRGRGTCPECRPWAFLIPAHRVAPPENSALRPTLFASGARFQRKGKRRGLHHLEGAIVNATPMPSRTSLKSPSFGLPPATVARPANFHSFCGASALSGISTICQISPKSGKPVRPLPPMPASRPALLVELFRIVLFWPMTAVWWSLR